MGYQVTCDCGKAHPVTAADAGSSLPCDCGRTVEVPALHELKLQSGETALSADAQLEGMLLNGTFPGAPECVCCHRPTNHIVTAHITCDRPTVKSTGDPDATLLGCLFMMLPGIWILPRGSRERRIYGRDVQYTVPLRVCEQCERESPGRAGLIAALRAVPVCSALLDKYPNATTSRAG
jgi:hypothetical protein